MKEKFIEKNTKIRDILIYHKKEIEKRIGTYRINTKRIPEIEKGILRIEQTIEKYQNNEPIRYRREYNAIQYGIEIPVCPICDFSLERKQKECENCGAVIEW